MTTFTATLPDGNKATRTSNRVYTHAVAINWAGCPNRKAGWSTGASFHGSLKAAEAAAKSAMKLASPKIEIRVIPVDDTEAPAVETQAITYPTLIVKKFDNFLRDDWYHVSVDGVKTELEAVDSPRGEEITALLTNAPQGKRYVYTMCHNAEKWELVDMPPTPAAEIPTDWAEVVDQPQPELFQFFTRNAQGETYMCELPFAWIEILRRPGSVFTNWEIRKQVGDRWVVIAQTKGWTAVPVCSTMQENLANRLTDKRVVDGLLLETRGTTTRIYFQSIRHSFSPCLTVTTSRQGIKGIQLVGMVSDFNAEGFLKASKLAATLL